MGSHEELNVGPKEDSCILSGNETFDVLYAAQAGRAPCTWGRACKMTVLVGNCGKSHSWVDFLKLRSRHLELIKRERDSEERAWAWADDFYEDVEARRASSASDQLEAYASGRLTLH